MLLLFKFFSSFFSPPSLAHFMMIGAVVCTAGSRALSQLRERARGRLLGLLIVWP